MFKKQGRLEGYVVARITNECQKEAKMNSENITEAWEETHPSPGS